VKRDIRAWCRACDAEDQVQDLIATVRAIESMYVERQRHMRAGLKRSQTASVSLYERTKMFRGYETPSCPACFTPPNTPLPFQILEHIFLDLPNNVDDAVAVRMERQRVLYSGNHSGQQVTGGVQGLPVIASRSTLRMLAPCLATVEMCDHAVWGAILRRVGA